MSIKRSRTIRGFIILAVCMVSLTIGTVKAYAVSQNMESAQGQEEPAILDDNAGEGPADNDEAADELPLEPEAPSAESDSGVSTEESSVGEPELPVESVDTAETAETEDVLTATSVPGQTTTPAQESNQAAAATPIPERPVAPVPTDTPTPTAAPTTTLEPTATPTPTPEINQAAAATPTPGPTTDNNDGGEGDSGEEEVQDDEKIDETKIDETINTRDTIIIAAVILFAAIILYCLVSRLIRGIRYKKKKKKREQLKALTRMRMEQQDDVTTQRLGLKNGTGEYSKITTASATHIGSRETQQDSLFVSPSTVVTPEESPISIGVVCDGMGGMKDGERASHLAMELFVKDCKAMQAWEGVPALLYEEMLKIDDAVYNISESAGGAGTTLVGVLARRNQMYWASVGDSRIYIHRNNEMLQVTRDHNYLLNLKEMAARGEITPDEIEAHHQKEALISYMGIGSLSLMDINQNPFILRNGDMVLLCSDGLYKSLSDQEIREIMRNNFINPEEAAKELVLTAFERNRERQDNTSVVLLQYTEQAPG